jgi:uncharacterized protein YndB with AHSA1/START domain
MPSIDLRSTEGTWDHPAEGRDRLRFERRLAHPPDRVWSALTDPDELSRWFPSTIEGELRVGATLRFPFRQNEGPALEGRVVELEQGRILAYTWGDDLLRWELHGESGATRLVFTTEFASDRIRGSRDAAGWHVCLDALEADLDRREPDGQDAWKGLQAMYAERFRTGEGTHQQLADGRHRLRYERLIAHPIERVWQALTDPGELIGWLGRGRVTLVAGGAYDLDWLNSDTSMHARIAALDPPRILELDTDTHGVLHWELAEDPGGTRLTLEATYPAASWEDVLDEIAGWDVHLDFLAQTLDGNPVDWPTWPRERWQAKRDRYPDAMR